MSRNKDLIRKRDKRIYERFLQISNKDKNKRFEDILKGLKNEFFLSEKLILSIIQNEARNDDKNEAKIKPKKHIKIGM